MSTIHPLKAIIESQKKGITREIYSACTVFKKGVVVEKIKCKGEV